MNEIRLDNFDELKQVILLDNECESDVSVVGFYEDISLLIKLLCEDENTYLEDIEICSYESNGYDREFVLTLDSTGGIWCEPLYHDDKYLTLDDDIVYIFSDVNSKCLRSIISDRIVEILLEDDDQDIGVCGCPLCNIEQNKLAYINEIDDGFYEFYYEYEDNNISYSTSYASKNLDEVIKERNRYFWL